MQAITLLGFVAGILTTISFVPQVHKAWRTKRKDRLHSDLPSIWSSSHTAGTRNCWIDGGRVRKVGEQLVSNLTGKTRSDVDAELRCSARGRRFRPAGGDQ